MQASRTYPGPYAPLEAESPRPSPYGPHMHSYTPEDDGYDGQLPGPPPPRSAAPADGGPRPERRKRNRLTLSCTHCRERKIKCSRNIPCIQCTKRGEADSCRIVPYKHMAQLELGELDEAGEYTDHAEMGGEDVSATSYSAPAQGCEPWDSQHMHTSSHAPQWDYPVVQNNYPSVVQQPPARCDAHPQPHWQLMDAQTPQPYANRGYAVPTLSRTQDRPHPHDPNTHVRVHVPPHPHQPHPATHPEGPWMDPAASYGPPRADPAYGSPEAHDRTVGPPWNAPYAPAPGYTSEPADELSSAKARIAELEQQLAALEFERQKERAELGALSEARVPSLTTLLARTGLSEYKVAARGRPKKTPRRLVENGDGDADSAAAVLEVVVRTGAQPARPDGANLSVSHRVPHGQGHGAESQEGDHVPTAECSIDTCPDCREHAQAVEEHNLLGALPSTDLLDPRRIDAFGPYSGGPPPVPRPGSGSEPGEASTSRLSASPQPKEADRPHQDHEPAVEPFGAYADSAKMAAANHGLFRLKQGPDSLLGWGLGWALGAAEVAAEFTGISNVSPFLCPGAPERESVLRGIIRTLPPKHITMQLIDVYRTRVYYLTGHVVHIPSLVREVERFFDLGSSEKQARIVNHLDPGWLAMLLMVLVLGMQFYPNPGQAPARYTNIDFLFDGRTVHTWYSAFKTTLILADYMASQSVTVLQAILLAELYSAESDKEQATLLQIAIRTAYDMGLHRLGDQHRLPKPGEAAGTVILRETYRRIWWTLVWRDWCASETTGMYSIQRNAFNTPLPGNYNDADLCHTRVPSPHPDEIHTEMSYVLAKLVLANVVRETTDTLNTRDKDGANDGSTRRLTAGDTARLDVRYRTLLSSLPSFFSSDETQAQARALGSSPGPGSGSDVSVQRWLLHQAVFSKLLRLHRVKLSSDPEGRGICVRLARSLLAMQRQLRSAPTGTIVDRLWFILLQSFNAAVVLLLDLLASPPADEAERTLTLTDVHEAIAALDLVRNTSPYVVRSLTILRAMQSAEAAQWQRSHAQGPDSRSNALKRRRSEQTNVLNLALKIKEAIATTRSSVIAADDLRNDLEVGIIPTDDFDPLDPTTVSGLLAGRAPGDSAATHARKAGLPSAADYPYLLGPPPGQGPLELPAVGPNGTALSSFSPGASADAASSPAPSAAANDGGVIFDLATFMASYQTALSASGSETTSDLTLSPSHHTTATAGTAGSEPPSSVPCVRCWDSSGSGASSDLTRISLDTSGSASACSLPGLSPSHSQHLSHQPRGWGQGSTGTNTDHTLALPAAPPTYTTDLFFEWIASQGLGSGAGMDPANAADQGQAPGTASHPLGSVSGDPGLPALSLPASAQNHDATTSLQAPRAPNLDSGLASQVPQPSLPPTHFDSWFASSLRSFCTDE